MISNSQFQIYLKKEGETYNRREGAQNWLETMLNKLNLCLHQKKTTWMIHEVLKNVNGIMTS